MKTKLIGTIALCGIIAAAACSSQKCKEPTPQGKAEISAALFPDHILVNYKPATKGQAISESYDVRIKSGITAKQLDKVLAGKLKNKGLAFVNAGREYGIDPIFLAALCCHESANGSSRMAISHNNIAGQLKYSKAAKKWLPVSFKSVNESINYLAKSLSNNYLAEGKATIEQIQRKYCPIITDKKSKGFNDPTGINQHWISGIIKWMKRF